MVKIREQVDRVQFVVLVFYHVLATVVVTAGRWLVGKITAVLPPHIA